MYEAPDRYKRLISARLPGGEFGRPRRARVRDDESSPLRDVQLISRAQLAPFFAAANIIAALMMAASLWGSNSAPWLLPWAAAVAAVNLGAMHLARTQSITCVGRSGRRVPTWMMVGEVAVRAIVWLSLPLYLFPTLEPGSQVIAASIMAGLGIGALGLVVVPPCVTAWMVAFTAGVGGVAADRPRHRSLPAHAVDHLHARRRHLRRADRRPLGVPPTQDQRRRRQPERERQPAASGI